MIINYLRLDHNLDLNIFKQFQQQLPPQFLDRNRRFRRFIDRQRNLFGLLLLKRSWSVQYHSELPLEDLRTTEFNRPFLPSSKTDFNISHAGDYVVSVLNPNSRVGIDIELKKMVDFSEFTITMNQSQWDEIRQSSDPVERFFENWCIKESVIKADGRGLSLPLTEILIHDNSVSYADKVWHIQRFTFDPSYCGCLASDQIISDFVLNEVKWSELL